ncbi:Putative DEAH-box ATP-dependent helicase [Psilocybe cubensis]|uniref:RNA helicase n=2 Tax=Psilocybe cubensis TaxID=181762 RepID=A0A8H7Y9D4_PSICU|nr:Putative DEAH-box ATP-dependent helicase [Psilocybe cubensis]KAH9486308.1 Putative DEAH-box ATP-dependent helicase [Psilocybe cubensis]
MPPKRGIVKSGNAGNSSKSDKNKTPASTTDTPGPPPLFPPGSKYPLSILQERCQKLGWEKPVVDTRSRGSSGFSFVVTLSRRNPKTSEIDRVRMEPHPPYFRPTAMEAKHWGATYALYRFCNGLQLNQILPPGPRDYWKELAAEHKSIREHQKWMYEADPFSAQKAVEERQAKASQRDESKSVAGRQAESKSSGHISSDYPEVIMASSLRELVEDAIKKSIELYPDTSDSLRLTLSPEVIPEIAQQLGHLDFKKSQIQDATKFLSEESPLTFSLLSSLSPLEAAIEYLVLHLPECDLPQRFLPSNNASNPFITSAHSGQDDLKKRWIEEKAVKEAGWPLNAVNECTKVNPELIFKWDSLMVALGRKLVGSPIIASNADESAPYSIEVEEYEALGAHLEEEGHLILPLFSAPIVVHILFSETEKYPRPGYIPIYITSATAPAYIRLHLLSKFLKAMESRSELEHGEGFFMTVMRIIEEAWADIEDNGPPNISVVLKDLIPTPQRFIRSITNTPTSPVVKGPNSVRSRRIDIQDDSDIKRAFDMLVQTDKYKAMLEKRMKLPAFQAREDFLDKLERNRVVVVVGETGCGKTTQLPQFILDSLIQTNRGSTASILVTQPRRLSAISVAARVSEERIEDGSVGYAIRGESRQGKDTKLLFCTTGVVLRRLSTGDTLKDISHIVVDEVHERSMDGDFLLLELKELLKVHPTLKVVLMSATINHETFVKYFDDAPLLTIPGFMHPVEDKYLEDILSETNYRPPVVRQTKEKLQTTRRLKEEHEAEGISSLVAEGIQNIMRSDRIDYQLISALVNHIIATAKTIGGILIFLPGVNEIRQCVEAVRSSVGHRDALVLPLHANLSNEEQRRVFQTTKNWKIIASTNVAETSITIDDIIYVVDAGKVKETQFDPETNMSRLVETWINRAAARQRRGRAGRTRPGVCYKLYTRKHELSMAPFPVPEILRVPLESISLSVKATREDEDVKAFLSRVIDPPAIAALDRAWTTLEEIGAIDQNGGLTALGKYMSMLPVDIRLAKMLILGTIFQCIGPVATVAALLSSKPLFNSPMDKRDEAAVARARFLYGDSDLLTDVNAFDECMKLRAEGKSQSTIRAFYDQNFISAAVVREITTLRQDFISSLAEIGLIPLNSKPTTQSLNTCSDNLNLVKAAMLGGLWPRVARVQLPTDKIKYDKVSGGTVQRDNSAKDYKILDLKEGRVFLHPGSVLFAKSTWKPPFLFYFHKYMTNKIFLRDATKVPMYALLLFGGPVSVNHIRGGLTIGSKDNFIKLAAIPRIGILVNQLRRLLDAQLQRSIEDGTMLTAESGNPVVHAIMALLTHDGRTEDLGTNTPTNREEDSKTPSNRASPLTR